LAETVSEKKNAYNQNVKLHQTTILILLKVNHSFSASSAFHKPTPARRTSLSTQHIQPSGIFDRWSDGLELAA